tara:strand:- start:32 stop:205 length:174 start_codon:yes stop_codon:yes gene_type:complete
MTRRIKSPVILINHWRWLEANGYKKEATSCKRQAASLTRKHYSDMKDIKGESIYENK